MGKLKGSGEQYFSGEKVIAWRSGPRRWSVVQPVEKVAAHNKANPQNTVSATVNRHIAEIREHLEAREDVRKIVEVPYLTTKGY